MNISEIADISTAISGMAVVVTLVLLLMQMRENTAALERTESNATMSQTSAFRMAIINNREVAALWNAGLSDAGSMDETDESRFRQLLTESCWMGNQIFRRAASNIFDSQSWNRIRTQSARPLISRRGLAWWEKAKSGFPDDFAAELDAAIADLQANRATPQGHNS